MTQLREIPLSDSELHGTAPSKSEIEAAIAVDAREPRFCKDCGNFEPSGEKCLMSPRLDLVTGKHSHFSASVIRGSLLPGDCGPDGVLFIPKLTERAK